MNNQQGSPWKIVLLVVGLLGFIMFACVCGGFIWLLSGPDGGVRLSNEMESYAQDYLVEHEILNGSETLIAYYDVTLRLDGSEAAILTNERVIYHRPRGTTSLALTEITNIEHRTEGIMGTIIEIEDADGIAMKIEIAPLNQGQTFVNALEKAWENSK